MPVTMYFSTTCSRSYERSCWLPLQSRNYYDWKTWNEHTIWCYNSGNRSQHTVHRSCWWRNILLISWRKPHRATTVAREETFPKTAKTETHNNPENEMSELQNFHKPTAGTIDYKEGHFKDNAKIRLEQNDRVLRNLWCKKNSDAKSSRVDPKRNPESPKTIDTNITLNKT